MLWSALHGMAGRRKGMPVEKKNRPHCVVKVKRSAWVAKAYKTV
jgi:hypothetical protein